MGSAWFSGGRHRWHCDDDEKKDPLLARCQQLPKDLLLIVKSFALSDAAIFMLRGQLYDINVFMRYHAGSLPLVQAAIDQNQVQTVRYSMSSFVDTISASASFHGFLTAFEWFDKTNIIIFTAASMRMASESGNMETIQWLIHKQGLAIDYDTFVAAAEYGDRDKMQWLLDHMDHPDVIATGPLHGDPHNGTVMAGASRCRNHELILPNLQWLHDRKCPLDADVFANAALVRGDLGLRIMKWLYELGCPRNHNVLINNLCGRVEPDTLEWLWSIGTPMTADTFAGVVQHGNFTGMEWLLEKKCPWNPTVYDRAVTNINLVRWLREHGCPMDAGVFWMAAVYWSVPGVIEYLYEQKCPWDSRTFNAVLRQGTACFERCKSPHGITPVHLMCGREKMQWLYDRKCPWDDSTFACLAFAGNIRDMTWLMERGCPYGVMTFAGAARRGNIKIMKWLRERGCAWDAVAYYAAVDSGHILAAKWLKSHGCPTGIEEAPL